MAKHYPQYNSKKCKRFKSIDGHWVFIVPHGEMHHKMITKTITGAMRETRKAHNIDKNFWNNPWALVARSFLTIERTDSSHSGDYRYIIHNRFGSAVSSVTTLTVAEPPSISSQPVSVDEIVGEKATFTLTATEAGTLNYQWQKDGVDINNGSGLILKQYFPQFDNTERKWILDNSGQWHLLYNTGVLKNYLSGEITGNFGTDSWDNPWKLLGSNHFTIRSAAASDAGKYRCKVSNAGTTLSKEATLTINP